MEKPLFNLIDKLSFTEFTLVFIGISFFILNTIIILYTIKNEKNNKNNS